MKKKPLDGNAIVYCEGAFNTPNGKTAHGLVRFTERYDVLSIVDSRYAGKDAGTILDGKRKGIPIYDKVEKAIEAAKNEGTPADYFVIGLAPDGGRLPKMARIAIKSAMGKGLHIDSGLHDFVSEDQELKSFAEFKGIKIRDIRKTPPRSQLHFFSGEIEKVDSLKIAVLGTDSAIGKRTTSWLLVHALREAGNKTELVGTGQTAWMQGAKYSLIMDSLINDFVSGEIEHAVVSAWKGGAEVIVLEGQGSLMNPAYPGGFEILAAGRPDIVILQHAPRRLEYDGFSGYPLHPIDEQIRAIEVLSKKPVVAITINHEGLTKKEIPQACAAVTAQTDIPAFDVLEFGAAGLVKVVQDYIKKRKK